MDILPILAGVSTGMSKHPRENAEFWMRAGEMQRRREAAERERMAQEQKQKMDAIIERVSGEVASGNLDPKEVPVVLNSMMERYGIQNPVLRDRIQGLGLMETTKALRERQEFGRKEMTFAQGQQDRKTAEQVYSTVGGRNLFEDPRMMSQAATMAHAGGPAGADPDA